MANRFWVGGAATWDGTAGTKWALTTGGAGGQAVPTAADDVFFDAASGAVAVATSGARVARTIDFTGFTGGFTMNGNLNIGTTTVTGTKWLTLAAAMTWTYTSGILSFVSTSATQIRLLANGLSLGATPLTINGAAGSLLLNGAVTAGALTITAGAFAIASAGAYIFPSLTSTGAATRSIGLTTNSIQINGPMTMSGSGLTMTGSGRFLVTPQSTATLAVALGTFTYPNLEIDPFPYGRVDVTGAFSTGNFTMLPAVTGANASLTTFGSSFTVTGTLTLTGSGTRYITFKSGTFGTAITVTAAAVSLNSVMFMDITAAGAAGTWTGTRLGDGLGNSNITFAAPQSNFWVGGAGNWTGAAGVTQWATTSGGTGTTGRTPLPQDTAIFDGNSGSGTVTADPSFLGTTLTVGGSTTLSMVTNAVAISGNGPAVLGAFIATVAVAATGSMSIAGRTTQNLALPVSGPTIVPMASSTATLTVNSVCTAVTVVGGGFNMAGFNLSTLNVLLGFGTAGTWTLSTGTLSLTDPISSFSNIVGSGTTFSGASGTIAFTSTAAGTKNLYLSTTGGTVSAIGTLNFAGGAGVLAITSATTPAVITTLQLAAPASIKFQQAVTHSIGTVVVTGATISNRVTWGSVTGGSTHTISFSNPAVVPFADVTDSIASTTIPAYAQNGTLSNTTNWNLALTRATADTAGGTDAVTRTADHPRAQTDAAGGSDVATVVSTRSRTLTDAAGGSDAASRIGAYARVPSDAAGGTDSATGTQDTTRTGSDAAGGTDAASRQLAESRAAADTAPASDSASPSGTTSRIVSDAAGGTDSATRQVAQARIAADTVNGADAVTYVTGQSFTISDAAGGTDVATYQISRARTGSDGAGGSDTVTRHLELPRFTTDSAPATDVATGDVQKAPHPGCAVVTISQPAATIVFESPVAAVTLEEC